MTMNKDGKENLCNVQERAQTLESELGSNSAAKLTSCVTLRKRLSLVFSPVNGESTNTIWLCCED